MSQLAIDLAPAVAVRPGQRVRVVAPLREVPGSMVILEPGWVGEVVQQPEWMGGRLVLVRHSGGRRYWLFAGEVEVMNGPA